METFIPVLLYRKWCKVRAFVQNSYSAISEKALISNLKADLASNKTYLFFKYKICINKHIISSYEYFVSYVKNIVFTIKLLSAHLLRSQKVL